MKAAVEQPKSQQPMPRLSRKLGRQSGIAAEGLQRAPGEQQVSSRSIAQQDSGKPQMDERQLGAPSQRAPSSRLVSPERAPASTVCRPSAAPESGLGSPGDSVPIDKISAEGVSARRANTGNVSSDNNGPKVDVKSLISRFSSD